MPFNKLITKLSNKAVNFEAGPVMGGKPFMLDTNIPLTEKLLINEKTGRLANDLQYGFDAENIMPQKYFDWLKYGDSALTEPNFVDDVYKGTFKNGKSPIHIKPANRGKFNATKKRTGKTTEELTHSSNPLTRKRAIFA